MLLPLQWPQDSQLGKKEAIFLLVCKRVHCESYTDGSMPASIICLLKLVFQASRLTLAAKIRGHGLD